MAEGYRWIKVYGGPWNASLVAIIIAEMEILDAEGNNLAVGGTPFGSPANHSNYTPPKAFDGIINGACGSMYYSASKPASLGYHTTSPMPATVVRLATTTYSDYHPFRLANGVVLGSNDSTDGFDGTWDTLATEVTMASTGGTWTSHPLTWGPNAEVGAKPKTLSTPIILSTMPHALTRGFR